jgi:glycosyltransferase involved in cell wall biosynthesis
VPGARLVLLGEGPERAVLAAQARELGVDARLAGRVAEAEVAAWLARASVLALPSRVAAGGDRDGLANVLLEAMASGVPVVTTAAGSAEDAVAHRRTGLIVPPDDPAALAAALRAVLAEPALAAALAARARRLVEQRYTLEVNTLRLARWLTAAAGSREVDSCPTKLT